CAAYWWTTCVRESPKSVAVTGCGSRSTAAVNRNRPRSAWPTYWTSIARSNGSLKSTHEKHASWKCVFLVVWTSRRSPRHSMYLRLPPSATGSPPEPGCMTPSTPDSSASRMVKLEALYWELLQTPREQRESLLADECPDDPGLQRDVRRMLDADERAG